MWTQYLEMLGRDASAVEYEGPVLAARASGESPEVVEQLEHGKQLALKIRDKLIVRQRREDELTALSDTAYDLARLSDLDAVLEAIVHRARQLLHTDIAYLTMNDPDAGDTYMRVTDGSTSARFQQVRLAMGEGLGGRVAESAIPYSTASYFRDARFKHTQPIDGAVEEEGIVAILGVPLQLGAHVIGVLYAANRSERPFSRSEVALLSSLAAHAAAAIDKARLLEEAHEALRELRRANVLLEERGESVERASDAHDRMAQVVLRGGGVEDVAEAVAQVLAGDLLVLDESQRELAVVGAPRCPGTEVLVRALSQGQATGRTVHAAGEGDWWMVAITAGQQSVGSLVLDRDAPLDDADQRILERAALVIALLLLSLRSGLEAESRVRGELLDDLLRTQAADPAAIAERAHRLGSDLDEPHAVFVVHCDDAARERVGIAIDRTGNRDHGLTGSFEGRHVLVLPGSAPAERARQLAADLGRVAGGPVTVGSAGPACGVRQLVEAHDAAVRCVHALRTLGRTGEGACLDELGFVGLVLGDQPDVAGFVRSVLGPVVSYDARRSTDLLGTLTAYFAAGGNLTRTAAALHVHVNTVTQRLERIGRLLGPDWQGADGQLELQVALRLHSLVDRG
jgi:GAF domain-containing protein